MTEGGREEGCEWRDQIKGCGDFIEDSPQRMKTRVVGGD